jgi:YggT family protein
VGEGVFRSMLLADAASTIQHFVTVFTSVYLVLILVYILMSWLPPSISIRLEGLRRFLYEVCEPYLRLFRRVIPPIGPLDLSPIVAIIVLTLGARFVNAAIRAVL